MNETPIASGQQPEVTSDNPLDEDRLIVLRRHYHWLIREKRKEIEALEQKLAALDVMEQDLNPTTQEA